MIGSTTIREPEFDQYQRNLMLAVKLLDADIGPHGQPMAEATSPEADPAKPGGWHYEANQKPRVDHAAAALARRQRAFYDAHPEADRDGHLWYVTRIDDE